VFSAAPAYTPFYASWLNRIEALFRALQARQIRRYIALRNRNTDNARLRALVNTANVA
jgi:transposase